MSLKPLNERSLKFRRTRYFSEFDDFIVKTFYFMFRPFSPLIEVGIGDFKGKIWFAFTEYQNPPSRSISTVTLWNNFMRNLLFCQDCYGKRHFVEKKLKNE